MMNNSPLGSLLCLKNLNESNSDCLLLSSSISNNPLLIFLFKEHKMNYLCISNFPFDSPSILSPSSFLSKSYSEPFLLFFILDFCLFVVLPLFVFSSSSVSVWFIFARDFPLFYFMDNSFFSSLFVILDFVLCVVISNSGFSTLFSLVIWFQPLFSSFIGILFECTASR